MKEGWEYKTIKECCTELFAGGDVPKPDVSKNKTQNFTVPIYTNGVENEGLYGYTNNARQQGQQSNSQTHPELLKALPPKEELQRAFVESSRKENEK